MPAYAGIHLIDAPYCIDNAFDYYIPPHLRRDILCGDFVTVPFGVSNNAKLGLVLSLLDGVVLRIGFSVLFGIVFSWGFYGFVLGYGLAAYGFAIPSAIYFLRGKWKKQGTLADKM